MDTSAEYHEPIYYDKSGCYITVPQLRFFVNQEGGRSQFINGSPEFIHYFHSCKTYNLVSDLMEKDSTCAEMYWDEKFGTVVFAFPIQGLVARKFAQVGLLSSDNFYKKGESEEDLYSF